jgi:hypothetical protein
MKLHGSYLVLSETLPPCTVLISASAVRLLNDQVRIAEKHGKDSLKLQAYRQAFGLDAAVAFPCWIDECMAAVVANYKGAHEKAVRGLAACIVTGTPYGGEDWKGSPKSGKGGDGGQKVKQPRPQPVKPSGGSGAELLFGARA